MSDREILHHVLSVERDAAALEKDARDQAVEILRTARAELAAGHEAAVLVRRTELAADLDEALGRVGRDQALALAAWRAELQAMPAERDALAALIARLLAGDAP